MTADTLDDIRLEIAEALLGFGPRTAKRRERVIDDLVKIATWSRDRYVQEGPTIRGDQFGFIIGPPRANAPSPLVTLLSGDDGNWFRCDTFDAGWLTDLSDTARMAKVVLEARTGHEQEAP